jgi:hypothetical protein
LVESWAQIPQWLRVLIGLQIVAAGWLMHLMATRMGTGSHGPAGFTIGLGLAVVAVSARNRAAERDGE